jgi:hypothetical protein
LAVTIQKASVLVIVLSTLWGGDLRGQSGGRDLPRDFRSLAGVTLNRDSAATIRATLGTTRERRLGTGHAVYTSWCYRLADGASRALLEVMSDASDLGTPGHALNVIRLRTDAPSEDREGCARLPASASLSTPGGLRLGLGVVRINALLGRPTRSGPDSLIYYFGAKEYLRSDSPAYEAWDTPEYRESCFDAGLPYASVEAIVVVVLRDGQAAEIRLERYDQSIC